MQSENATSYLFITTKATMRAKNTKNIIRVPRGSMCTNLDLRR